MSEKALTPQLARELADVICAAWANGPPHPLPLAIIVDALRAHAAEQEKPCPHRIMRATAFECKACGDTLPKDDKPAPERGESREELPLLADWNSNAWNAVGVTLGSRNRVLNAMDRLRDGSLALVPSEELERLREAEAPLARKLCEALSAERDALKESLSATINHRDHLLTELVALRADLERAKADRESDAIERDSIFRAENAKLREAVRELRAAVETMTGSPTLRELLARTKGLV